MVKIGDYNTIISDRNIFNQVVYTPISQALKILEERKKDKVLIDKVEKLLKGDIPKILKEKGVYGVQFRQIATPNNEVKHFLKITKDFGITPIFMEYHDDKFSSNNAWKRSLGQIHIQGPINKKDEYRVEKLTIMDFNKHNGVKLNKVTTHKSEMLTDFHRKLFQVCDLHHQACNFYDTSKWIKDHGAQPVEYYQNFFLLFTCFGILFENFSLTGKESKFTSDVILPSMESVYNLTGVKPLIVPIPPMDMENEDYWIYYDGRVKSFIKND
jgi:hypothetical protein